MQKFLLVPVLFILIALAACSDPGGSGDAGPKDRCRDLSATGEHP